MSSSGMSRASGIVVAVGVALSESNSPWAVAVVVATTVVATIGRRPAPASREICEPSILDLVRDIVDARVSLP